MAHIPSNRHLRHCFLLTLFNLFANLFISSAIDRKSCTTKILLKENNGDLQLLANLLSPLVSRAFFTEAFESQPILIRNRSQGFYGGLIDLDVIGEYLKSQDPDFNNIQGEFKPVIRNLENVRITHGDDWKLVKRVWRNGEWWCSTPNISFIPIEVVFASFQRKGYSIVINKMQDFHPPLKRVTNMLESIFGCRVNANVYLTPDGSYQAFESHFDWMDGFILQIVGCKVWSVDNALSSIRPLPDTVFKVAESRESKRAIRFIDESSDNTDILYLGRSDGQRKGTNRVHVRDGSLLYIPRGTAHEAATNCSTNTEHTRAGTGNQNTPNYVIEPDAVSSLHVTFGLEAATDSTVEIFLHNYISIYFKLQAEGYPTPSPGCSSSNSAVKNNAVNFDTSNDCDTGMICGLDSNNIPGCNSSRVRCVDGGNVTGITPLLDTSISSGTNPPDVNSTPHMIKISMQSLPRGPSSLALEMRNLTRNDLVHLILHVAAVAVWGGRTTDKGSPPCAAGEFSNTCSASEWRGPSTTPGQKGGVEKDSALLRQAVATTTFTALHRYQPLLCDVLPQALEYLRSFLSHHSSADLVTKVVLLAIDMDLGSLHLPDSKPSNPSGRGTRTKNLNYIKRFMTSSPIIQLRSELGLEIPDDNAPVNNIEVSFESFEEIFNSVVTNKWDADLSHGGTPFDAVFYVLSVFDGLDGGVAADDIREEGGEGADTSCRDRSAVLADELYCASWVSMMDRLRAQRTSQ